MDTNAHSALTARVLADARVGTFTGLITRKVGVERGRGADRKVYGDDLVHTVIFTGFSYTNLVRRSLEALKGVTDAEVVAKDAIRNGTARFTEADVAAARAELVESFEKTLAGTNESTTDAVYEPLVVDGETVKGARVYRCKRQAGAEGECHCRDCAGDARAPKDGTIYLQGLAVWSTVLEAAPNGPAPEPNSSPKTLAKEALRKHCPIRKYVSYRLEPKGSWSLRAGGTAAVEATSKGFVVTDAILDVIERNA